MREIDNGEMALMEAIPGIAQIISKKVIDEKKSYENVSRELKAFFPNYKRGLSSRSVRRYTKKNNIHRSSRLNDPQLDRVIGNSIAQVSLFVLICSLQTF